MNRRIIGRLSFVLALGILMSVAAPDAGAANDPVSRAIRKKARQEACESDAKTLCVGIQPGKGRLACCLHDHVTEIKSSECKSLIEKGSARLASKCSASSGSSDPAVAAIEAAL